MKYSPAAVSVADIDIYTSPYFGGEYLAYLTQVPALKIGEIDLTAANTGTWRANPGVTIAAATDLQVNCMTAINSTGALAIALACMDNSGTPVAMNGTASFAVPARAANQSGNLLRGFATDLVPATNGKLFTAVTGMASSTPVTNGGPNQVIGVYQLPVQADYELIEGTTEIDFVTKSRPSKGVDNRMESDYWNKRGKSRPSNLTLNSKFRGFIDGVGRYDGQKCTLMLVGVKDGQVTGDRLVFTQFVPSVKPTLPDGEGEAMIPCEGKFVDHLFFIAP